MVTAIAAIIVFGLLILFHELGHFSIAKWVGIKVHEFSIGMGPQLGKFTRGETMYSLRLLPIGGYVKMEGEDESSEDERAFGNKSLPARIAVVVAGAVMNFILGYLLFVIMFSTLPSVPKPIVNELMPGMPAQEAGLLPGDRIVQLNNYKINLQEDIFYFLSKNKDNPVRATISRNGQNMNVTIKPRFDQESQRYLVGYTAKSVPNSFVITAGTAYYETAFISKVIVVSLADLVTGKLGLNQMSGPVGIVKEIGSAAKAGMMELLNLAALISINLGIFNLLPIPALDGGRVVFLLVEGIRRKPINPEKEGMVHAIGFALLILLLIVVTFKDVMQLRG